MIACLLRCVFAGQWCHMGVLLFQITSNSTVCSTLFRLTITKSPKLLITGPVYGTFPCRDVIMCHRYVNRYVLICTIRKCQFAQGYVSICPLETELSWCQLNRHGCRSDNMLCYLATKLASWWLCCFQCNFYMFPCLFHFTRFAQNISFNLHYCVYV